MTICRRLTGWDNNDTTLYTAVMIMSVLVSPYI